MKNILHITYDMRIGGTEQVIKNLVEGSDKSRYHMSILCIESPIGPFGQMLQEQGVRIDTLPRRDGFDSGLIRRIRRYIKQQQIDILHCHQYTPWVYGCLAAIGTGKQVIFTEHGRFYPDSSSWKRKLVNPVLDMLTDHITAISEATRQALVGYEYLPAKRISVVYNGIHGLEPDDQATRAVRQQYALPDEGMVLGTIARLDPIKNHKMMLDAFSQVLAKHPDTRLVIVGDGEMRGAIEAQIDELGLGKHVILTGYVAKPQHLLNLMDIFLLSSLSEGTSMTLLEAMSLGKPCVVTKAGGNPEIIKHNHNGLVTKNDDADAFAEAIIKLIEEPDTRNSMQQQATQRFTELFTAEKMAEAYAGLYDRI